VNPVTRFRTVIAGALGAAVLLSAGVAGAAQAASSIAITSVDASAYPSVTAVVTVPGGLSGASYAPDAFQVVEAGSAVRVSAQRMPTTNLEIMLVVDTSGSMRGTPLTSAQAAANAFLALLPAEVKVGVVGFASAPRLIASPTTDRSQLATRIAQLTATGDTALYDAVVFAQSHFSPGGRDRAIVLLSDGADTTSSATLEQAAAAASGARMSVIELAGHASNRLALERLAQAGGGAVSSVSDPAALTGVYRLAAGALVNRYRLAYTSHGHGPAELRVRLTTPQGVLEGKAQVHLPPAPPVAPPTTTAPTTLPITAPPVPVTAAVPATTPVPVAKATAGATPPPYRGLILGAAAFFGTLLLLGWVCFPADRRARLARVHLGVNRRMANVASMSQVKDRMAAAADRMLEQRGRRRSLALTLEVAGIPWRSGDFVVVVSVLTVVAAAVGFVLAGLIGLAVGVIVVPLAARTLLRRMVERRRAKFAEFLPDSLQMLTSTLKSGFGILQALDNVAEEAPEPARSEFRRVLLEIRLGRDMGSALHGLADRMQSEDFEWVVGAIDINREVGGDLAMILQHVGETIRERQRLLRHMQALTAEGRLSAYILTGLPVGLVMVMAVIDPEYLDRLRSGIGLVLVGVGVGLLLAGWLWMKRLIRIEY
jgi:tight adherence protein B